MQATFPCPLHAPSTVLKSIKHIKRNQKVLIKQNNRKSTEVAIQWWNCFPFKNTLDTCQPCWLLTHDDTTSKNWVTFEAVTKTELKRNSVGRKYCPVTQFELFSQRKQELTQLLWDVYTSLLVYQTTVYTSNSSFRLHANGHSKSSNTNKIEQLSCSQQR